MSTNVVFSDKSWENPVTDRTVESYLNCGDLNRIEGNIEFLSDVLNRSRYNIEMLPKPEQDWGIKSVPTRDDIRHICDKVLEIADSYYKPPKYYRLHTVELNVDIFEERYPRYASFEESDKDNLSLPLIKDKVCLDYIDLNDLEDCLRWMYSEFERERNYNSHSTLAGKPFTHTALKSFTHSEIRKDGRIIP